MISSIYQSKHRTQQQQQQSQQQKYFSSKRTPDPYFHSCGSLVILKYIEDLEIMVPYCPVCHEVLSFDDYPHLRAKRDTIKHKKNERTLILDDSPLLMKNKKCTHSHLVLIKQATEHHRINYYQCKDCGKIIRERD